MERITDIYNEVYLMRVKKDQNELIDDVVQGELGDCYFLSALSALAEREERIKKLFVDQVINKQGYYIIRVYINGLPVKIVVDDFFPCMNNSLAFSSIEEDSLNIWPLLLEKAWAKVNSGYNNIIEGNVSQAFEFLTPSPNYIFYHSNCEESELYKKIKIADEKDFIICCDISDQTSSGLNNNLSSLGLLTNHAYSIISVHEITTRSGESIKLLKIRNPWGNFEWNGDWSDNSNKWTTQIKNQLGFSLNVKDEGIFFMSFKDYFRFFTTTYINKYHKNNEYVWKQFEINPSDSYNIKIVSLKIKKPVHAYLYLHNISSKIYASTSMKKDYANNFANVTLLKVVKESSSFFGSASGRYDKLVIEEDFTPGEYLVIVKFPKKNNTQVLDYQKFISNDKITKLNFTLAFYSELLAGDVLFEEVDTFTNLEQNLFNAYVSLASSEDKKKEFFYKEGEPKTWRYLNFNSEDDAYGALVYKNESNALIREQLKIISLKNIQIIPISKLENNILNLGEKEEEFYEDIIENDFIETLKSFEKFGSKFSFNYKKSDKELVSTENMLTIDMTIAPSSYFVVLFEKIDEVSSMKCESSINLEYPTSFLWNERKFLGKKQRIKYKDNKQLDLFESVIRHSSGLLFKYKNKTREHRLEVKIKIENIENLALNNDLFLFYNKMDKIFKREKNYFQYSEKDNLIKLILEPNELILVDFKSVDPYQKFGLNTKIDYLISLSQLN